MVRECSVCRNEIPESVRGSWCPSCSLRLALFEPHDDLAGQSIGNYKIVKEIGKGGYGNCLSGKADCTGPPESCDEGVDAGAASMQRRCIDS